ncbi:DUF4232 domain-containing protein [Streptomyces sp. NPDC050085]|uniref:DUF4232 domain-containing protein n=1 Tax=Streptomyces sp. NPDC050085 TaxID=3365600 RepID=UPI0037AD3D63
MTGVRTSRIRTSRIRRTRLATAAATVAIAAFSLTACNDGSGVKDEGPSVSAPASDSPSHSPSTPPSASASASASPASDGKPAPATSQPGTAKPKPRPTTPSDATAGRRVCDGSHTRTTAAPVNRPVNHMLLTVTNTGSTGCDLYYYPAVRFGEAQSVPPVIEESQPQAVVSLEPGQSAYAGVALSATDGSGSNGYTAKTLTVSFAGRDGLADYDGPAARPALPAKGVYVDDSIKVTYWQSSMDNALTW